MKKSLYTEVEDFPQWAAYYAAYGESDTLSEEECQQVDDYMAAQGFAELIEADEETFGFSWHPAFGLPCEVINATFRLRDD